MKACVPVVLAVVGLSLPAATALAQPRNVLVAKDRTEPIVAVDPRTPSTLIVGSNTNYDSPLGTTFPVGYFTSRDGGSHFQSGNVPTMRPYIIGADPSLAFADSGTAFYTYLGESPSYCGGGPGTGAVMLSRSYDAGASFRGPSIVDANSADDKPNLAVESGVGPRAHLFVSWTRWLNNRSEVWLARSRNGGDSFEPPQQIVSSSLNNWGSVPIVGPRHHIYVFWVSFTNVALTASAPTRILMRESTDDGLHFGPVRTVVNTFLGMPRMAQPGLLRNITDVAVVAGRGQNVYVAYPTVIARGTRGEATADIDFTSSQDGGSTWTSPVPVNDVHTGDRFMPALTRMHNGSLGIAFYDRRNGYSSLDMYAARIRVGGSRVEVSRNVRINALNSPVADIFYIKPGSSCFSPGRFFGDYIGVAADQHDRLCVVWADNQLQVATRTDIWFARLSLPRATHAAVRRATGRSVLTRILDAAGNLLSRL